MGKSSFLFTMTATMEREPDLLHGRRSLAGAHERSRTSRRHRTDLLPALAFLLPNFLGFLIFTAGPVLFSLGASFTNWDLQHSVPFAFVGLENFRRMFVSSD